MGAFFRFPLPGILGFSTAPPEECANFRLAGRGEGIHRPDLDEDISVAGLLAGSPSGESPSSLTRWLKSRA